MSAGKCESHYLLPAPLNKSYNSAVIDIRDETFHTHTHTCRVNKLLTRKKSFFFVFICLILTGIKISKPEWTPNSTALGGTTT